MRIYVVASSFHPSPVGLVGLSEDLYMPHYRALVHRLFSHSFLRVRRHFKTFGLHENWTKFSQPFKACRRVEDVL